MPPAPTRANNGVIIIPFQNGFFIPPPLLWMVSDGLTGFITGLFKLRVKQYNRRKDIATAVYAGMLGVSAGIFCEWVLFLLSNEWSVISYMPGEIMSDPDWAIIGAVIIIVSFFTEYGLEFLREMIAVIVLLPILMLAYHAIVSRRSSSNTT
ncbi:MAG: hypothetical protein HYR70_04740 [Chloroflexi bacterium]|nr:hypothetical protein [Chloroflexota bacterium]MBI1855339.1 hypothetical protein [Chloroflexota bacterium]MBI3340483.1 hypothetical protein [Chloroflexota bacterium]